jgi:hypothetical protein
MVRLKNRDGGIPNGISFYLPQSKWVPRPHSSFRGVTEALYNHLQGNPGVLKATGWKLDMNFIADKVDEWNAKLCETNGWSDFITTEAAGGRPAMSPFPFLTPQQRVSRLLAVAAGSETLVEWLASGAEAVSGDLANSRAVVCAACPMNEKGTLSDFFTTAASEAIRRSLNLRREWKLETTEDEKLGVCSACYCPLRLKVFLPLDRILKRLAPEIQAGLPDFCWIKREQKAPA